MMKISCSNDCIFRDEKEILQSLKVHLQATIELAEENEQSKLSENEKVELFKLLDSVKGTKSMHQKSHHFFLQWRR